MDFWPVAFALLFGMVLGFALAKDDKNKRERP
jgi:hypothetical protein